MGNLFQTIVLNSLNMTLVALLLMLILRALKGIQSPKIRYYSWLIVLIGFLIPVRFSLGHSLVHVSDPSGAPAVSTAVGTTIVKATETGFSWVVVITIIFLIWLWGMGIYALVSVIRFSCWKRTVLRLSVASSDHDAFVSKIAEEMGISSVKVRISDAVSSPMMIGLTSPIILIPNRSYEYDELRLIMKHELMHFLHKDLWFKLLLIVCRAVHWFNPFMVLFARSIEQECEYYCDMSVMEDEPEKMRKIYCTSIVNTLADQVRRSGEARRPILATNFYSPKSGLKHRFSLILRGKTRKIVGVLILAVALTLVSGFVLGVNSESGEEDGSRADRVDRIKTTEEWVENIQWTEEEVEETTYYEEYTTWIDSADEVESSAYYTDDEWEQETFWEETTAT